MSSSEVLPSANSVPRLRWAGLLAATVGSVGVASEALDPGNSIVQAWAEHTPYLGSLAVEMVDAHPLASVIFTAGGTLLGGAKLALSAMRAHHGTGSTA
jgi:hypothetical protein